MTAGWLAAASSDVGLHRDNNEDAGYAGPRVLVVADGMGGQEHGEVASATVVARLIALEAELAEPTDDLSRAVLDAVLAGTRQLEELARADPGLNEMATTLTAVVSDGEHAVLTHVGDSRAYLWRAGQLEMLSHDHTVVQDMVDRGHLTPAEARHHPRRHVITRALGAMWSTEPDVRSLDVAAGDRLLLCSDGLTGVVSDDEIARLLPDGTPDAAVHALVNAALAAGGPDNITVVVAEIGTSADTPPARVGTAAQPAAPASSRSHSNDTTHFRSRTRSHRRRYLVVAAVVVGVAAATAGAGWAWTRTQFYVGSDRGQVVVFRGVDGSVGGVNLSSIAERSDVNVARLPTYEQDRVRSGITAANRADARRIVARLRDAVSVVETTPVPSASPSAQ